MLLLKRITAHAARPVWARPVWALTHSLTLSLSTENKVDEVRHEIVQLSIIFLRATVCSDAIGFFRLYNFEVRLSGAWRTCRDRGVEKFKRRLSYIGGVEHASGLW